MERLAFTPLPIMHPLSFETRMLLNLGGFSVGGYPLYLCGGADTFSDIDVFAPSMTTWLDLKAFFEHYATPIERTAHAQAYRINRTWARYDLVDNGFKDFSWQEVVALADLSPAACALVTNQNIQVLYPHDVTSRICRVLDQHEYTSYRLESYKAKGYQLL